MGTIANNSDDAHHDFVDYFHLVSKLDLYIDEKLLLDFE
jgi:hypothetical protein